MISEQFTKYRGVIAEHFAIDISRITEPRKDEDLDQYYLLGGSIEVLTLEQAFDSEYSCIGKDIYKYLTPNGIGAYRRLGQSELFFKWQ